ncbi:PREDICTED: death-associated protein 1-like [Amphimedon queenslandica]|uniref:Death-associated protein 1 n=1 Tax=Amphimedon queenslandica TaxID=400682 RepID=A0A1X7VCZ4_AMPQE|nr:PREDICTED: death-associated protein 1-like [Amphimedon queenslandica]|eukprot:XP_003384681.1 PREDICTED: death-associated protein 1-like [Amphimedon queenslandica]
MSEGPELKAGHPPAVKAGGMRIVTKHKHKEQDSDAYDEKYKDTVNPMGGTPVKVDMKQDVAVAGLSSIDTPQSHSTAIKSFHEKPKPTHEKYHAPPKQMQINQPRKN